MIESAAIIFNIVKEITINSNDEEENNENFAKTKNEYTWKSQGG